MRNIPIFKNAFVPKSLYEKDEFDEGSTEIDKDSTEIDSSPEEFLESFKAALKFYNDYSQYQNSLQRKTIEEPEPIVSSALNTVTSIVNKFYKKSYIDDLLDNFFNKKFASAASGLSHLSQRLYVPQPDQYIINEVKNDKVKDISYNNYINSILSYLVSAQNTNQQKVLEELEKLEQFFKVKLGDKGKNLNSILTDNEWKSLISSYEAGLPSLYRYRPTLDINNRNIPNSLEYIIEDEISTMEGFVYDLNNTPELASLCKKLTSASNQKYYSLLSSGYKLILGRGNTEINKFVIFTIYPPDWSPFYRGPKYIDKNTLRYNRELVQDKAKYLYFKDAISKELKTYYIEMEERIKKGYMSPTTAAQFRSFRSKFDATFNVPITSLDHASIENKIINHSADFKAKYENIQNDKKNIECTNFILDNINKEIAEFSYRKGPHAYVKTDKRTNPDELERMIIIYFNKYYSDYLSDKARKRALLYAEIENKIKNVDKEFNKIKGNLKKNIKDKKDLLQKKYDDNTISYSEIDELDSLNRLAELSDDDLKKRYLEKLQQKLKRHSEETPEQDSEIISLASRRKVKKYLQKKIS